MGLIDLVTGYARLAAQTAMLAMTPTPVPAVKINISLMMPTHARLAAQTAMIAILTTSVTPVQLVFTLMMTKNARVSTAGTTSWMSAASDSNFISRHRPDLPGRHDGCRRLRR